MKFRLDCIEGENLFLKDDSKDMKKCNYLKSKGLKFEDANIEDCIQLIESNSHIMYDQFLEINSFEDFKELINNIPHVRIDRICGDVIQI